MDDDGMGMLLTGMFAGLLMRPEVRSMLRPFEVFKGEGRELILRFTGSKSTYRIRLDWEGYTEPSWLDEHAMGEMH